MKSPEEILTRGTGNFLHCTDYETAIEALQKQQRIINELTKSLKAIAPFADKIEVAPLQDVTHAEYILMLIETGKEHLI